MKKTDWQKIIKASADPARVKNFLNSAEEIGARSQLGKFSTDAARILAALVSGSQYLAELLITQPDLLSVFDFEQLRHPRRADGIRRDAEIFYKPKLAARDYAGALTGLRRFKLRETLRIAARDLGRLSDVVEITRELSDVADVCLNAVLQICSKQFSEKFGRPFHRDAGGRWQPTAFCILGLGKLGGQELNYSSDVDLIYIYEDEGDVFKEAPAGKTPPHPVMSNHQYFCKLAEMLTDEISRATEDGFLYRVDLRLRPEGDSGPVARSLESCENYYAQWGQTWERMMLIKTRQAAGDGSLASEFLEMIQPFRFPRSVSPEILQEIAATKTRLENEVVRAGELERNVKLGRGGIREIEFTVQSLQVLHAGRIPFLQIPQTLPCLAKLSQYDLLKRGDATQLHRAYGFLRDVEHRLQMENNLQTHTLPEERPALMRLARLMNFTSLEKFQSALRRHTGDVRRVYESLLGTETPAPATASLPLFDAPEQWTSLLAGHSFREPEKAAQLFKEFAEGPGYLHVSARTTELARLLIPQFLALCPPSPPAGKPQAIVLSDPDRVLARMDSFIGAYGSRASLFELWKNNPKIFELLILLFDRSEFLAEIAIRTPDLIDGLVSTGRLQRRKSAAEILKELSFGLDDADQFLWLRRYHETELMRLGLRDISGQVDIEQTPADLSAFADACLQYALEVILKKNKIKSPPLAIIGLGKLGGGEIAYGSDLDLFFVAGPKEKNLPALQKLAAEVMDLLSRRTEQGMVFLTDTRLRPDGEKGMLVPTLDACENYYRERAQLWEIQALTRARFVAGRPAIGDKFQTLAVKLTNFSGRPSSLVSRFKGWKEQIHHMRMRVEKERTPPGKDDLAIKTGKGGLMDAEFIAQTLCLENGWHEPNTLYALERGVKILPEAEKLIENYRQLRRVEAILRRWSDEGETVLPDDAPAFYRVSVRCGFDSPDAFRTALAKWRRAIRDVYREVFLR